MYYYLVDNNVEVTDIINFNFPYDVDKIAEFLKDMPKPVFNYIFDGVIKKKDIKKKNKVSLFEALESICGNGPVAIRAIMDDGTVVYGVGENLTDASENLKGHIERELEKN